MTEMLPQWSELSENFSRIQRQHSPPRRYWMCVEFSMSMPMRCQLLLLQVRRCMPTFPSWSIPASTTPAASFCNTGRPHTVTAMWTTRNAHFIRNVPSRNDLAPMSGRVPKGVCRLCKARTFGGVEMSHPDAGPAKRLRNHDIARCAGPYLRQTRAS